MDAATEIAAPPKAVPVEYWRRLRILMIAGGLIGFMTRIGNPSILMPHPTHSAVESWWISAIAASLLWLCSIGAIAWLKWQHRQLKRLALPCGELHPLITGWYAAAVLYSWLLFFIWVFLLSR